MSPRGLPWRDHIRQLAQDDEPKVDIDLAEKFVSAYSKVRFGSERESGMSANLSTMLSELESEKR